MNELLKAMYDCLYTRKDATDTVVEIENCHRQLIERLDKPERKLILQIMIALQTNCRWTALFAVSGWAHA